MIRSARPAWLALLVSVCTLAGSGCEQLHDNNPTAANSQPEVAPAPAEVKPAPKTAEPVPDKTPEPAPAKNEAASAPAPAAPGAVKLEKIKFAEFRKRVANKDVKYTIVDCWDTDCVPCKENFPHVVAMHEKFAPKGLAVVSMSFDDPDNPKKFHAAETFLKEKNAKFTNYLLDEGELGGFEKFEINAIPAVFLYGPDGQEVARFTLDDPNNQFTYDEVEAAVTALLEGKPLPEKPRPSKDK